MDDPKARRPAGYVQRGAESDGKGFGKAVRLPTPFLYIGAHMSKSIPTQPAPQQRPAFIAIRKTCDAEGTGLSHFVLMDKQVKK